MESITPYESGKPLETLAAELGIRDVVRLSANESPLGPSPSAVEAIRREAERSHLYPDGGSSALRDALGRALGISPEQVVAGNGADELIALVALAAFDPGDEAVVPAPSFEPYTSVVTLAGGVVRPSPLVDYRTDLDDVRRKITTRTKAIFLCSPHNPAGTILREGELRAFLDGLGADAPLVVLDEAYRDFCDDPEYPDGVALLASYPCLVSLRTFSKIAGLAGLRIGYAVAGIDTIDRLNRVRAPYNVNRLAQAAAVAALADTEHLARTRAVVLAERAFLAAELARRGCASPPSQANFLLPRVPDASWVRERLFAAGILVRDGAAVGFPGHLRIAVGSRAANERLLRALDEAVR